MFFTVPVDGKSYPGLEQILDTHLALFSKGLPGSVEVLCGSYQQTVFNPSHGWYQKVLFLFKTAL